jgi:hypothetical protein
MGYALVEKALCLNNLLSAEDRKGVEVDPHVGFL